MPVDKAVNSQKSKCINLISKGDFIMVEKKAMIFQKAHVQFMSEELVKLGRLKKSSFTRKRKLGFRNLLGIMLNFCNRTLQIELDNYFEHVLKEDDIMVSKQAFSKARQNLNPEVFRYLSDGIVETFYSNNEFDRFYNYRILAVDGSCIELPNFQLLKEAFGHVGNSMETVRAYASAMFDIENQIIITSEIDNYRVDERTLAKRHLTKLKEIGYKNDLLLYDRGYPSRGLMAYHYDEKLQFLMRCKDSFLDRRSNYKGERDEIFTFTNDSKEYSVRRVQFILPSGEVETLVTSLMEESLEMLKELYSLRWGIETQYHVLKHVLQIENFSGYSTLAIKQDFYATIYLSNLAAGFLFDDRHQQESEPDQVEEATVKYEYKVNRNELYGILKNRLITAVMMENPEERIKIFDRIMDRIRRNMVPVRPGRSPERKCNNHGIKYPVNQKKSL